MKRIDKIKAVVLEIEHYTKTPNTQILWPLPDSLRELLVLYDVQSESVEFLANVNELCTKMIQDLIKECKDCFGKDENFINLTIKEVKEYAPRTMQKFKRACDYFNQPAILEQEI